MSNYNWDQQGDWFGQQQTNANAQSEQYNQQWEYNDQQQQNQAYADYNNYNNGGGGYRSNDWGNSTDQGSYYPSGGGYYPTSDSTQQQQYGGSMFIPTDYNRPQQNNMNASSNRGFSGGFGGEDVNFEDEPPLLEELGINFDHIRQKTMAVLNPLKTPHAEAVNDQDLAGPLVFALMFGGSLLLHGKVQFGYIYGIGVLGCVGMYFLLNMMSQGGISLTCTVSVLGYCLLPMAMLSALAAVLSFKGVIGLLLSGASVCWCSASSAKLFVTALDMHQQQLLVAYPCALLYAVFALLAVF